jgi:hypothetical protein
MGNFLEILDQLDGKFLMSIYTKYFGFIVNYNQNALFRT